MITQRYNTSEYQTLTLRYLTSSDQIWPRLSMFVHVCPDLTTFVQFCPCLSMFDHLYPHLTSSDQIWPRLSMFDQFWPRLTRFDHLVSTFLRMLFDNPSGALRIKGCFSEEDQKKSGRMSGWWVVNRWNVKEWMSEWVNEWMGEWWNVSSEWRYW